jgi:hypothetical protein
MFNRFSLAFTLEMLAGGLCPPLSDNLAGAAALRFTPPEHFIGIDICQ